MNLHDYLKQNYSHEPVSVIGLGVSNLPLVFLLLESGVSVVARDRGAHRQSEPQILRLKELGATLLLGDGYLDNLNERIIFKTPGIRSDLPPLAAAKERGAVITGEMSVFFSLCRGRVFGVTGSDGKTTTSSILHKMLLEDGKTSHLGGNIGAPFLSRADEILETHTVVAELSSFQLETMAQSPSTAVITNISPNHLDFHDTMDRYVDAKKNIYRFQSPRDRLVLNFNCPYSASFAKEAKGEVVFFHHPDGVHERDGMICMQNEAIFPCGLLQIPGRHNVENFMAAIGAVWGTVSKEAIVRSAGEFRGVPHRLELVRRIGGVCFYNDSIASSPTRTRACLNTFSQRVILIAGGYDKKIPFDSLGRDIATGVKTLVLTGATAGQIEKAVRAATATDSVDIFHEDSMAAAVGRAWQCAKEGDIIVLSPACASFDRYKSFEERGNEFKKIVMEL